MGGVHERLKLSHSRGILNIDIQVDYQAVVKSSGGIDEGWFSCAGYNFPHP